jgi:hypothetical protein
VDKRIPITIELDLYELMALLNCASLGACSLADLDAIPDATERAEYRASVEKAAEHSGYAIDAIGGGPKWNALIVRLTTQANDLLMAHGIGHVRLQRHLQEERGPRIEVDERDRALMDLLNRKPDAQQ